MNQLGGLLVLLSCQYPILGVQRHYKNEVSCLGRTQTETMHTLVTFSFFFFPTRSEVGQVFALSWLITWYGHVLKDFPTIVRLYDFFLATHPLMPVYFGAAVSLCVVFLDATAEFFSTVSVMCISITKRNVI